MHVLSGGVELTPRVSSEEPLHLFKALDLERSLAEGVTVSCGRVFAVVTQHLED